MSLEHTPARAAPAKRGRRPPDPVLDVADRWLSRREAAEYLGLEPQTLAHDAVNRKLGIPFAKFGRLTRYKLSSLIAWAEARQVERVA